MKRYSKCSRPQRKQTKRGMRCVSICSGGRVKPLPNSRCGLQTRAERHGLTGCGCGS